MPHKATSKRKYPKGREKFHTVMSEFKKGTLHSGSGQIVKSRKQAIAIAFSEQRKHNRFRR
ncbi:MAG: DUF6496 domain-containing protein [bacterium]